jgi:hypothetical protein
LDIVGQVNVWKANSKSFVGLLNQPLNNPGYYAVGAYIPPVNTKVPCCLGNGFFINNVTVLVVYRLYDCVRNNPGVAVVKLSLDRKSVG